MAISELIVNEHADISYHSLLVWLFPSLYESFPLKFELRTEIYQYKTTRVIKLK